MKALICLKTLLLILTVTCLLSSCSVFNPRSQMRSKEVTRPVTFTSLPAPEKNGKVKADKLLIWCLEQLPNIGDINARMQRVRDAE